MTNDTLVQELRDRSYSFNARRILGAASSMKDADVEEQAADRIVELQGMVEAERAYARMGWRQANKASDNYMDLLAERARLRASRLGRLALWRVRR